jgi:hypothetical protein
MKQHLLFLLCIQSIYTFSKTLLPFKDLNQPIAPDYAEARNWSALPFRKDAADMYPKAEGWVSDSLKDVDVFYVYPTLYSKGKTWNADISNNNLNNRIDKYPVKYQASVFNAVGRVYAPRYRQAIIASYFDTTGSGKKALDFAYEDIKRAFEYYLKYYNNGRPIIIASHSQGTTHCRRLLKDYFDTPAMKAKLVCAYVVGYEIYKEDYTILTPCKNATETNCYLTWSTFRDGYQHEGKLKFYGNVCINPISCSIDTTVAVSSSGILLNVNRKKRFTTTAYIKKEYLSVKTNMLFMKKADILHTVDFNLFWFDIRKNVAERVKVYLKKDN